MKRIVKIFLLLNLLFLIGSLGHFKIQAEDYFGVTVDMDQLNDKQRACLCTAACYKENWNCAVVSCYYDPSNSCNEYYQGECYCGGFGCGRAKIGALSGGEMLDCMVTAVEPDTAVENFDKQIKQNMEAILIYLEKGNESEAQAAARQLLNVVNNKLIYLLDKRQDLDNATKAMIKATATDLISNVRFQKPGQGSKIDSCGFLWTRNCLYLDPVTSGDIIMHELSHVIVENLTPDYQIPGGDSSHDFFGYSATHERAYDEALATLLAVDLMGDSRYSSIETDLETNYNTVKTGNKAENEYEFDFVRQEMTEYANSDSEDPQLYDDKNLNWYGFRGKSRETALNKLEEVQNDLELARKNKQLPQVKALTLKKQRLLKYLNPPVASPKSEVAVSSLIWDLSGSEVASNRLGRIKKALDDYYAKFNVPPRTEQEFLQGFLLGKDPDSKDFKDAYNIITGVRHQRKYLSSDLIK